MIFENKTSGIDLHLTINHQELKRVNAFNFLGLNINDKLDWSAHINNLCKKIGRNVGILRRLRHQLPLQILKMLYYSLIHSHLSYMILMWGKNYEAVL